MRFGIWRGVTLALALVGAIAAGSAGKAQADLFHTIPREVDAVDVNTGGPYMAPPIPYGHYAKDCLGGKLAGLVRGCCGGGHFGGKCGHCNNGGCGLCGKSGLFGGHCGNGGDPCGNSGSGCGRGLFGHGGGRCGKGGGLCGKGLGSCVATPQSSPQATIMPSSQSACGASGCFLKSKHLHRMGRGCNLCQGNGCNSCNDPGMSSGSLCDKCHGKGCGLCGGSGICAGVKSILGAPHALVAKLLHKGEIEYFVGPGGPVPITPGYVPYVVTTRSPRDFFAFPPFMP